MGSGRMARRDWLRGVAVGALGLAAASRESAKIFVRLDRPLGVIRPELYGQFTEHIGGVIYDGIWVGPDSKIANIQGFRKTLVEHVRQLGPV
ncbi:MAG: hypothetical protein U0835_25950, partial [Isosphaeraceae bacterium]